MTENRLTGNRKSTGNRSRLNHETEDTIIAKKTDTAFNNNKKTQQNR